MRRSNRGFTLVNLVSVIGTLSIVVAIIQTDVAFISVRRSAQTVGRLKARVLAQTALVAGSGTAPLELRTGRVEFVVPVAGQPPTAARARVVSGRRAVDLEVRAAP